MYTMYTFIMYWAVSGDGPVRQRPGDPVQFRAVRPRIQTKRQTTKLQPGIIYNLYTTYMHYVTTGPKSSKDCFFWLIFRLSLS